MNMAISNPSAHHITINVTESNGQRQVSVPQQNLRDVTIKPGDYLGVGDLRILVSNSVPKDTFFLTNTGTVKDMPISAELVKLKKHIEFWFGEEVEAYTQMDDFSKPKTWVFRFYFTKSKRKAHCNIFEYGKGGETFEARAGKVVDKISARLGLPVLTYEDATYIRQQIAGGTRVVSGSLARQENAAT